jgi:hypothetical protein
MAFLQLASPPVHPSIAAVARAANATLGAWLAFSAWIWEQPFRGQLNGYAVGAAITIVAINAFWFPVARFFNTALAVWLAWSVWVLDVHGAARVNTLIVAALVFLISLVPGVTRESPERPAIRPQ